MKKRILALLLVLSMLVSMVPTAFAADGIDNVNELQDAFNAGGSVTLTGNIVVDVPLTVPAGKQVELDLNGKVVSGTHGATFGMIHVLNGGELIVNDSSADKSGKITFAAGGNNQGTAIWVEGALVLESGTIEITGDWVIGFAVDVRPNAWGTAYTQPASFTMKGGKIVASDSGVRVASNSSDSYADLGVFFTMEQGQIESQYDGVFVQHLYKDSLNVEIDDGAISSANTHAIRIYGNDTGHSTVDMEISGGSFDGRMTNLDKTGSGEVTIYGGAFSTDVSDFVVPGYEDNIVKNYTSYVSLGDSMTNGLGLPGGYDSTGSNGYNEISESAYPYKVASYYGWELTQLATSAMRAEDLHYILEVGEPDAYQGDSWTQTELVQNTGRWNSQAAGGKDNVSQKFQTSIIDADVISVAVGNSNFGVYMMDMVNQAVGMGGYGLDYSYATLEKALEGVDAQSKAVVMGIYENLMAYLVTVMPEELATKLGNNIGYVVASYVLNYNGVLDRIVELNPDAEIIIVGLMNTMSGYEMDVTYQGKQYHIDMASVLDMVLKPMNVYLAALPTVKQALGEYSEATLYYAEVDRIQTLSSTFEDTYKSTETVIRDRFVNDITDFIFDLLNMGLIDINLADVMEYETAYTNGPASLGAYAAQFPNKAASAAVYLAIENSILKSLKTTPNIDLDQISGTGSADFNAMTFLGSLMGGVMDEYNANVDANKANLTEMPDDLATLYVTTESLEDALESDGLITALLSLYGRLKLANGMSAHPSVAGHDDLTAAIIAAYDGQYTPGDHIEDTAEEVFNAVVDFIAEYYDDIYAVVYDYAAEQEYIAAAVAGLTYAQTQIAAIDVDALDLSDALKAELKEEAALAIQAIESLKTLLLTADELDNDTLIAAQALLSDLTDALENMNDILVVAGTDLENVVREELGKLEAAVRAEISAAIERAETALENLKKYIDEDLAPAVRAEIEKLIETIEGQLAYLQAVVEGTIEATVAEINKALAALEQAVTDLVKAAQNEANQLLKAMLNELKALAQATVAEFEAAIYDATHISLNIYEDQYFVSLGGATAYGAGVGRNDKIYSDLVEEALEAEGIDVEFKNLTKADLTYDGLVDYVKANAAEIAKATLITYNMDASGFVTALLGNEPDWSAYFDEAEVKDAIAEIQAEVLALQSRLAAELDAEALAALAQAEQNVLAALNEQIDPETAKEIAPYAEKLLYAAVSYAVETAKALEAIHQINPDAEVILVGMYNPLAGTTVTVGGEVIDLGEIMEYAMEATDLYHLIYAAASGNVAFVDVSDTAVNGLGNLTVDDPKLLINSLGGILMNAGAQISANVEGHAYIAEQILDAIDFIGLLGDVNDDGIVDSRDLVRLSKYFAEVEGTVINAQNADVTRDGIVDSRDMVRMSKVFAQVPGVEFG